MSDKEYKEKHEMDINDFSTNERFLESQEINDAEHNVIKGDTVGETLYSAKWILNTLINLSKVYEKGWNESIETDLCTLWDMTAEKDIVEFLLENDFFKIAEFTLRTCEEPRLMEIIVGIIGNMCCNAKCLDILVNEDDLTAIILSLITSDDKETLIQVIRILQAVIWDIQKNPQSLWLKKIETCVILGEAISFILKSSTSDELLTPTIDLVYLISDIDNSNNVNLFENIFDSDQLIFALCEAIIELIKQEDNLHTEMELKNIENWLNIIFNIIKKNLLIFSDNENDENDENFKKINEVLIKILHPYKIISNLELSEKKILICIQQCVRMVFSFQRNDMFPFTELIEIILKILINLQIVGAENKFEDNSYKELYKYIINYWIDTLKIISKEQMLQILKLCDHKTVREFVEIMSSTKVSENCIFKLLETVDTVYND